MGGSSVYDRFGRQVVIQVGVYMGGVLAGGWLGERVAIHVWGG